MRKSLLLAALILLFPTVLEAYGGPSRPDTLRVLAIGNSFSVDAVDQNLHEIAAADGHVLIIGNMVIGGCFLEKHWRLAAGDSARYSYHKTGPDGVLVKRPQTSMSWALADEKWDVVTFHQSSGLSGQAESYEPYLTELLRYVKARTPRRCRMMMHQTWAYAEGSTNHNFPTYGRSQEQMYEALCQAYGTAAKRHRMGLIPSGTAVQNSRHTFNRENVTRDGYHLHKWFGRYLVACTWYEALYGTSVVGNAYRPPHLDGRRAAIARQCAHAACRHPFTVTRVDFDNPFDTSNGNWKPDYINTDPSKVPDYTLPDALTMQDGRPVQTAAQWFGQRRPELLELFETEMFGKAPGRLEGTKWEMLEEGPALGGLARRKQVRIIFPRRGCYFTVLIYLPAQAKGPIPVFMGLNFEGNATVQPDPAILYPDPWRSDGYGIYVEQPRGTQSSRWPVDEIVRRGYGLVTFHNAEIDPDFDDGFDNGVTPLIYREGQNFPEPDQWGTLSAWAWGMSRVLDYLEEDPDVDAARVAAIGHSRLGKTALLAAARDERFAMAISNDSGCGGAALSRRRYGETIRFITGNFPHWFCGNFFQYVDHEDALPFDQHEFLALIAPRPLYVASAEDDSWTDPVGERLAFQGAQAVYDFLGLDRSLTEYHIREGAHELTREDWLRYLDFADKHFNR
ncbi:MAG: DUF4886 domain-containing protein [Bacteroidales bacterium]|nr:DUF4886 domain-containing protein [Bacteroidales bacterium]